MKRRLAAALGSFLPPAAVSAQSSAELLNSTLAADLPELRALAASVIALWQLYYFAGAFFQAFMRRDWGNAGKLLAIIFFLPALLLIWDALS